MTNNKRFGKLIERQDDKDFPFYNDQPVEIKTWQWLIIIAAVAVGFIALTHIPEKNNIGAMLPRTLFMLIPLLTYIYFAKDKWKVLFSKPKRADYKAMLGFMVLNMAVSFLIAGIVRQLFGVSENAAANGLAGASILELGSFYVGTFIQIIGEELLTILPFLALMYFLYTKNKVSRKAAIIIAWGLTSLWFGAVHLQTYNWNVAQALLVIGGARIVLTLAYVRTKNLWVSFGAHLIGDWTIFTMAVLAATK